MGNWPGLRLSRSWDTDPGFVVKVMHLVTCGHTEMAVSVTFYPVVTKHPREMAQWKKGFFGGSQWLRVEPVISGTPTHLGRASWGR